MKQHMLTHKMRDHMGNNHHQHCGESSGDDSHSHSGLKRSSSESSIPNARSGSSSSKRKTERSSGSRDGEESKEYNDNEEIHHQPNRARHDSGSPPTDRITPKSESAKAQRSSSASPPSGKFYILTLDIGLLFGRLGQTEQTQTCKKKILTKAQ